MTARHHTVCVVDCDCCGQSTPPASDLRALTLPRGWVSTRSGRHYCGICAEPSHICPRWATP